MKTFFLPLALLFLFTGCGNEKNTDTNSDKPLTGKDSLKKEITENLPPPTEIRQFSWFYSMFAAAATMDGGDTIFDHYVSPEHGLWIISSEGAMPHFTNVKSINDYKRSDGTKLLPMDKDRMLAAPKEEELPSVDCNSKTFWNKDGCFTREENKFKEEKIWQYAGLTNDKEKEVEALAGTISRTVINTQTYRFYFSLINGSWYLTFLDIRKPCEA
ncbi:MAG TPA: hypothetical protein VFU15_05550 [Bacteroidia bacterium]|nr:hypothetical protein [Bacteroidia bacterium]